MVWMIWPPLIMFKCLGILFEILKNPLQSSSLICQSPTKAIWWYLLKTLYTYATCLTLSFVKLLWPFREFFYAFMIKIHVHIIYPLLCFFEKLALYHPLIPQNKCSPICVGLSLSPVFVKKEERHWLSRKKMDTWRSKYWKKRERKNIWTHEGPWWKKIKR